MLQRQVWSKVFDVNAADTPACLSVLIQVLGLVTDTRRSIESLENIDKEVYLQPIKNIEDSLTITHLDAAWVNCKRHITEATIVGLAFCADTLSRVAPEEVLDNGVLNELKHEVEAMSDYVEKSEIKSTLKAVILDHLESIRRAVVEYKARGTQGLREALDSGIGSLIRHRDELRKTENQDVMKRLRELFGKIEDCVGVAAGALKLFNRVTDLLQLGG